MEFSFSHDQLPDLPAFLLHKLYLVCQAHGFDLLRSDSLRLPDAGSLLKCMQIRTQKVRLSSNPSLPKTPDPRVSGRARILRRSEISHRCDVYRGFASRTERTAFDEEECISKKKPSRQWFSQFWTFLYMCDVG